MDRQSWILAEAQRHGRVSVDALADELGVSTHTIRRDINVLCEQSKLRRLHGGAEYIDGSANMPYGARAVLHAAAKQNIAREAARHVPNGSTVFISIGTTPAFVASALSDKESLTVVTNNLNAAMAVSEASGNRVIVPGGVLRLPDRDILNQASIDLFSAYRADIGIYGVGGIDRDGSLLDFYEEEVRIRQAIRANARLSMLVADKTKFGRRAAAVGGSLSEADLLVIDEVPGADFAPLLEDLPGRLVVAQKEWQAQ